MTIHQKIHELKQEAEALPYCDTKVNLLAEAVRLADVHNLEDTAYEAREKLITAATFSGHGHLTLLHFPWMLAKSDANPTKYSVHSLMWKYKWMLANLPEYPQIPKEKIMEAFEDFKKRFNLGNYKKRTLYEYERILAMEFGDLETAQQAQQRFEEAPKTDHVDRWIGVANCHACEINNVVSWLVDTGQLEKALETAVPLITRQVKCENVPRVTYPKLLLPLLKLGKVREAKEYFRDGYKGIHGKRNYIISQANILKYLVIAGHFKAAKKWFLTHQPFGEESLNPREKQAYLESGWLLFHEWDRRPDDAADFHLPPTHPLFSEKSPPSFREIADDYNRRMVEIAQAFDARNGNNFETRRLAEFRSWATY